ncbi:MAG: helicase HerA-like domain-containing protein, partial [Coriobacteriia bacterium]
MSEPLPGLLIGKSGIDVNLLPAMANRHGLVAGATGTGKTVTLQVLAESFSGIGVPVFAADIKGDLSGISQPGGGNSKVDERLALLGLTGTWGFHGSPVTLWDVFGEQGHPVRTTVSEVGPLLLGRMLNLNDTQEAVLTIAFRVADENGLLLLDIKDLRSMLKHVSDNSSEIASTYGNVAPASVGAIQRALLALEEEGGDRFFGEPALDLFDFMQTDANGKGMVNILAADRLMTSPRLYSTMLLWLLSELFERLPEAGDLAKPKLVFFFDEAHLLFDDAPPALLTKIEQVVRLIRSKGVGVYFVTQNPVDIPDTVLGQCGNKIQHALRAYTPREAKAVKAMAETFRPNPELGDVEATVTELKVGEALVSLLQADGSPMTVERTMMVSPHGRIGAIAPAERQALIAGSLVAGQYEAAVDRESAFELLKARADAALVAEQRAAAAAEAAELEVRVPAPRQTTSK